MPVLTVILASVLLTVVGQLFVKHGINQLQGVDFAAAPLRAYLQVFRSPAVLTGSGIYTVAILLWVYALSRADLSYAYPFTSISYVLTVAGSWLLLREQVDPMRWLGVGVVCLGIYLVSRS